jgi:hypothetical protein
MRWLFLIVLSLNLAYVAWQISVPASDTSVNVQPLNNVPPIILLSELKHGERTDSVEAVQMLAQASEQQEVVTDDSSDETLITEQNSATLQAVTDEKSGKMSDQSPEKITGNTEEKVVPVIEDVVAVPETSSPGENCYTLGPFRDLEKLRSLTREIKSYVVAADFRGREEREQSLYWVYIKPEKNRKKAIETGKRLKAKKIKDFYVIRKGEKINGLSLGHFRNKSSAYGLAEKVKKLGFDAIVEPVFKSYTIYWLDYQLADGVSVPETVFEKYIQSTKKDKISRLSRDCDA